MSKLARGIFLVGLVSLVLIIGLVHRLPALERQLAWRSEIVLTYLRGVVQPAQAVPTSLPAPRVFITRRPTETPALQSAETPTSIPTFSPSPTPTPSPTPLPLAASLPAPAWERQDINNCGPATLAMNLRYYGWEGDQFMIAELIKPRREDRNVNIDELVYYVRTRAGWLNIEYRVGGDIHLLKRFIAAGLPVMIEEGFHMEITFWPNDDHWAAHYLLLTGYDDHAQAFTAQDSFLGPNKQIPYQALDENWQSFNRLYAIVYLPSQEEVVKSLLGSNWNPDANRLQALQTAQQETQSDPDNAFAWFNMGTNLTYFERYSEAAQAYDVARNLGLPQRMLRYQFGPFIAYFHSGRLKDLQTLTKYALQITRNSEEALLWKGWGLYRLGNRTEALAAFERALAENPAYPDAQYAVSFISNNR